MIFKVSISEENWKTKYRYKDEDPAGTFKRVARAAAEVERKYGADDEQVNYWAEQFFHMLVKVDENGVAQGLKSTPGGRITANLGTEYKKVTPWNCFIESPVTRAKISYTKPVRDKDMINVVIETGDTPDNLSNIFLTLLESAETLKSEGGIGLNFGFIRPRGSLIKGVGIRHPGVVSYMELWDKMSEIIVKGDNDGYVDKVMNHLEDPEYLKRRVEKVMPRKGAMMAILPIWHPDVEEFIRAKQTPGKLTKFNISVLVDDAFMQAVESDGFYDLHFNGKVYKKVKARDMYDLIMTSTYNRAEPGVVFLDNANRINPLLYLGPETATNPCVAAGTMVATQKGLVPVEDIKVGDMIQTTLGFGPVKTIEVHRDYPVYKVGFSDGLELRVTQGHIFHTMPEGVENRKRWKNSVTLKDLKVGDWVRKEPYTFTTNKRPDLTRNHGFVAGYWLGNGCRHEEGRMSFGCNATEDSSFLVNALAEIGLDVNTNKLRQGESIEYYVRSTKAALEFFDQVGIDHERYSFEKSGPMWWLNTNKDFLAGVLDGLISSDGNVNLSGKYPAVRFKSTSLGLHSFMRELLLLAGADYKLYEAGKVGEKSEIYGRTVERKHDIWEGQFFNDCIKNVYKFTGGISHPKKGELMRQIVRLTQLDGTRWKVRVQSIEPDGTADVYDLFEELADDWNTHGIVSLGCGEVPGSAGIDAGYRNYAADYLKPYLDDAKDFIMGRTTVCLLGSVNLTMYVNQDRSFDYDMLREDIKTFARFLENINEFTEMIPLPAYRWAVENIRQYGMGFNGIGSTLFMLGHAYNSKEAEEFLHKIHFLRDDETLRASALLAKERGPFPMFCQEYLETPYFTQYCKASEDAKDLARKYGVRNAKRLTNPPLGNTSVICNNISNGIEPVFSFGYERTVMSDAWPEGMTAENVRDILPETKVGDATVWRGEYNGRTWYYEPHNRGLCFIEPIQDYGYRWVLENYPEDIENNAPYLVTAQSLSVSDHVKVQAICQEYCDQSISKTASVPNEYPFEDFKQLYMQAWKSGLVGFTTYRSGTMEEVLSVGGKKAAASLSYLDALKEAGCINDDAELTDEQVIVKNVKLPEEFDNGETYIVKREGNKYYIHFSYLKNYKEHPIALWIYSNSLQEGEYVSLNRATRSLQRLLIEKGVDVDLVLEQVEKNKDNPHHERLGKMVGMALRHNLSMQDIAHALEGIEGDYISSTLTAVRKFLKKHIKDGTKAGKVCLACESDQVIYEGGCDRCLSCGNSGCA